MIFAELCPRYTEGDQFDARELLEAIFNAEGNLGTAVAGVESFDDKCTSCGSITSKEQDFFVYDSPDEVSYVGIMSCINSNRY